MTKAAQLFGKKSLGLCLGVGLLVGASAMSASAIEIGNYVWCDENANGVQDTGEHGMNGVLVELYSCSGEFVMATNTATGPDGQDGWYLFTHAWDLYGTYYVKFHAPTGYSFTTPNQGGDTALDSNPDPITGISPCTTAHDLTQDAGLLCDQPSVGTGTPGYWFNHPDAWPVEQLVIGGVIYTKEQALALIGASVSKDKRSSMFPALAAAKLNVLSGTDSSCIADTIDLADAWMATYGGAPVKASSAAWSIGSPLHAELDAYNNGLLCAPARD
jgi:hypothetical protein